MCTKRARRPVATPIKTIYFPFFDLLHSDPRRGLIKTRKDGHNINTLYRLQQVKDKFQTRSAVVKQDVCKHAPSGRFDFAQLLILVSKPCSTNVPVETEFHEIS
jgi:hypothetical protein